MLFKERIVHFIEENSERFKLSYQSTLHSIQTLNVLEHSQLQPINAFIHHNWTHAKCLAINALIISANLYEVAWTINRRELIKAITQKSRDFEIQQVQFGQCGDLQPKSSNFALEECLWKAQVLIPTCLKWKLAMPLLYDQVMSIAQTWNEYTAKMGFILRFQDSLNYNRNYLTNNTRICLYNFNHVILSGLEGMSQMIRRLSLALVIVSLQMLMKENMQSQPRRTQDICNKFFSIHFHLSLSSLEPYINKIAEVLNNYNNFRLKSKPKQSITINNKHNLPLRNQPLKENNPYYINRLKSKTKSKVKPNNQLKTAYPKTKSRSKSQTKQNQTLDKYSKEKPRSKSRKDRQKQKQKQKIRFVRTKQPNRLNKKKSISTKSIICKQVNQKRQKDDVIEKERKILKFSKSRVSKHSQKSQLTSKFGQLESQFCSNSIYGAGHSKIIKNDKSTNSSIRMKLR